MPETIEKRFKTLTEKGYITEEELREKAYRSLLRNNPDLRITLAVEEYRKGEITLNRAAEIAGITTEEMKETLKRRGVEIRRGFTPEKKKSEKAKRLVEEA